MSTELDQQYNKNVWEVGEKLTGKVMMRQVHLLTLFNTSFRTSTMHDYWCIIIIIIVIIIINSLGLVLFPLIEPSSFHELRAVISLVDYLKDSDLLSLWAVPRRTIFWSSVILMFPGILLI